MRGPRVRVRGKVTTGGAVPSEANEWRYGKERPKHVRSLEDSTLYAPQCNASIHSSLHHRPAQNIGDPLILDTEIPNPVEERPDNARGRPR